MYACDWLTAGVPVIGQSMVMRQQDIALHTATSCLLPLTPCTSLDFFLPGARKQMGMKGKKQKPAAAPEAVGAAMNVSREGEQGGWTGLGTVPA